MEELKQLYELYSEYRIDGHTMYTAATLSSTTVFPGLQYKPLLLDAMGGPSHIFHNGHVLFFESGDIYKYVSEA